MKSMNVVMLAVTGVAVMLTTAAVSAGSGTAPVPEIGGSALPAAMGLLAAGVLTLRATLRRK